MVKRFLDCFSSDFEKMSKKEIIESIRLSEGRVIVSEVIGLVQPVLYDISNAELSCAFGADIILLNMFDVYNPVFNGIGNIDKKKIIKELKRLTGRIVAVNLEPIDETDEIVKKIVSEGRRANVDTAGELVSLGADMVVITANPKTSVSNKNIIKAIRDIKNEIGENIIIAAGKMHAAGNIRESGSKIININELNEFIDAGCDIVLLPAPGTVPGITLDYIKSLIDFVHDKGKLAMTTIGTSQEGADKETIKSIALMCKMAGADMHHLGDAGLVGIAIPENIMEYSIAIRGKRHTYSRMARSINR
ncbi:MAG: haloacid dehalogenase-like hydrolase [Clostridiales bacterium]|nr:haloacid dehalogenase-like hydrolase [Clostridiales bacterium]